MADTPDRQLAPVREPLQARTTTNPDVARGADVQRSAISRDMGTRQLITVTETQIPAPDMSWAAQPLAPNTGGFAGYGQPDLTLNTGVNSNFVQQQDLPRYDLQNPLGLSADLFSRFFSNAPTESPQSPVVVGDVGTSSGTGSNAGLLLVIAVLGIGGYFLYRRFKQ